MTEEANSEVASVRGLPARADVPMPYVPSVSECGLRLLEVRLRFLICTPGDEGAESTVALAACEGTLKDSSITGSGFQSIVAWSLGFPDGVRPPIAVSGKHELIFGTSKPLSPEAASYFAKVNSVILAFPYVRHLIDFVSVNATGRNLMVLPLDVPSFVVRTREQWRSELATLSREAGGSSDGKDAR